MYVDSKEAAFDFENIYIVSYSFYCSQELEVQAKALLESTIPKFHLDMEYLYSSLNL